jgi:hypothetical protein
MQAQKLLRNSLKLSSGCERKEERKKKKRDQERGTLGERVLLFFAGAADHHPVLQN